jgi:hypothetical protein
MKKENVKRRFDKHMGKELLKGQPWKSKSASSKNNCPFICLCTLEDLPQQKNPRALCQQHNLLFSTVPMFPYKDSRLHVWRFLYSRVVLRFKKTLGLSA